MKIRAHNELVFTVFFGKEKASERMKNVFGETYDNIDKAFTTVKPEMVYGSNLQERTIEQN